PPTPPGVPDAPAAGVPGTSAGHYGGTRGPPGSGSDSSTSHTSPGGPPHVNEPPRVSPTSWPGTASRGLGRRRTFPCRGGLRNVRGLPGGGRNRRPADRTAPTGPEHHSRTHGGPDRYR